MPKKNLKQSKRKFDFVSLLVELIDCKLAEQKFDVYSNSDEIRNFHFKYKGIISSLNKFKFDKKKKK